MHLDLGHGATWANGPGPEEKAQWASRRWQSSRPNPTQIILHQPTNPTTGSGDRASHGGGGGGGDGGGKSRRRQAGPARDAVPRVPRREAGGEEAGPEVRRRRRRLGRPRRRGRLRRHLRHRQLHRHLQDSQGRHRRPAAQSSGVGGSIDRKLHAAQVPSDLRRSSEGREASRRRARRRRLLGGGDTEIIAITVFFLLVIAFYAFFAPFLGKQIFEYVAIGIYTPVAFAVVILYIRCTSINPADPGIMSKFEEGFFNATESKTGLQGMNLGVKADTATGTNSPASICRSSVGGCSNQRGLAAGDTNLNSRAPPPGRSSGCCWLICALFVKEDCRKFDDSDHEVDVEDALFCTLCNAEVRQFSKHCRSCDKCVDGFDHHCRWLNNCVGHKNYFTFISLMITSLLWLIIELGVGIAVLVLCFVNKNAEIIIQDKLGNGLTRPLFVTIVGIFTLLSLIACVPLGELFFFHMLLIRKGITTYEYVVAMRAMSETPQDDEEEQGVNIINSPTNSATTGFSAGSSLGLHYKGAWCTPPRVFIDQDEVIPHLERGNVPSTVDPDAAGHAERASKAKKQVKISAWKLAKLDGNEAMKAAARARASSSVLQPIDARGGGHDTDRSSSGNVSVRSSMSVDYSVAMEQKGGPKPPSPRCLASQEDDCETGTQNASSMSSPVHLHKLAPHVQANAPPRPPLPPSERPAPAIPRPPVPPTMQANNLMFRSAATPHVRENRRASVVWDQDAGRYVSVAPAPSRPGGAAAGAAAADQQARTPCFLANTGGDAGRNLAPMNASSSAMPSGQPSERLTYSGQSIFFGGPVLGAAAEPRTSEANARARPDDMRELNADQRDASGEIRGRAAESLPVFAPGTSHKNPQSNR